METKRKKIRFWPFLAKNHEQTPWELGQNFKFPKSFCISKTSLEMMFGDVFRVIGNKVEENSFLAKNRVKTPWELGQNFKFP